MSQYHVDLARKRRATEEFISSQVTAAVEGWFRQAYLAPFEEYHLYYKPAKGPQAGAIAIALEAPDGYQLATSERLSPAWTRERARYWVREHIRRLPILATEGAPVQDVCIPASTNLPRARRKGTRAASGIWNHRR